MRAGGAQWGVALLLGMVALLAAGCGPKAVFNNLFPNHYAVESSVDFVGADGAVTRQTLVTDCRVVDASDAIVPTVSGTERGDAHWQAGPDGSLLLVGGLDRCRWTKAPGQGTRADPRPADEGFPGPTSYQFNNAKAPTRVEVLSTTALFDPANHRIARAELTVTGGKATRGLDAAFPGLGALKPPGSIFTEGVSSTLKEGYFNGVRAWVEALPPGADCPDLPRDRPSLLAPGACKLPFTCTSAVGQGPCTQVLGGLRVSYDPRFSRAEAEAGEPDRLHVADYYLSSLILAVSPPMTPPPGAGGQPFWTPRLCYQGVCATPGFSDTIRFYDPAHHRLVKMAVQETWFDRARFVDRGFHLSGPNSIGQRTSASR